MKEFRLKVYLQGDFDDEKVGSVGMKVDLGGDLGSLRETHPWPGLGS